MHYQYFSSVTYRFCIEATICELSKKVTQTYDYSIKDEISLLTIYFFTLTASLAQPFKGTISHSKGWQFHPHHYIVFEHMQSWWQECWHCMIQVTVRWCIAFCIVQRAMADAEQIMRSVCVAAYRVTGDATWLGCRKSLVLNKAR